MRQLRYTVSKSKEFEVLRKRLEDSKLQLDRALAFTQGVQQDLEVVKVAHTTPKPPTNKQSKRAASGSTLQGCSEHVQHVAAAGYDF